MYVERNGKQLPRDPWSFRQTGVVHRYSVANYSSQVILLHPNSKAVAQKRLEDISESSHRAKLAEHPLNLHLVVVSSYMANWQDHLESLASDLEQIVRACLALDDK